MDHFEYTKKIFGFGVFGGSFNNVCEQFKLIYKEGDIGPLRTHQTF